MTIFLPDNVAMGTGHRHVHFKGFGVQHELTNNTKGGKINEILVHPVAWNSRNLTARCFPGKDFALTYT